jgi:hypothetical protein
VDVRRVKQVSELIDITPKSNGILAGKSELFPTASNPLTTEDILAAVQIDGPQTLQDALRALVTEFADIFSNDVGQNPALVDSMKLTVNTEKWADSKNRTPPRPQSRLAEEEIRRGD